MRKSTKLLIACLVVFVFAALVFDPLPGLSVILYFVWVGLMIGGVNALLKERKATRDKRAAETAVPARHSATPTFVMPTAVYKDHPFLSADDVRELETIKIDNIYVGNKTPIRELKSFAVIDFETTGLSWKTDEIVEAAVVLVDNDQISRSASYLCRTIRPIPAAASNVHGITDAMVADKPTFSDLLDDMMELIGERTIVAHNASFDVRFINAYLKEAGRPPCTNALCTLVASKSVFRELKNYKLSTVASHIGFDASIYHRALGDATATANILIRIYDIRRAEISAEEARRAEAKAASRA